MADIDALVLGSLDPSSSQQHLLQNEGAQLPGDLGGAGDVSSDMARLKRVRRLTKFFFGRAKSTLRHRSRRFTSPRPHLSSLTSSLSSSPLPPLKHAHQAFANERLSPEVLPYEHDLISRVRDALARHEAAAADLERAHGDAAKPAAVACAAAASRCKYLLAAYHRARLHKVEACAAALLDTPGALDGSGALLSPAEAAHASDYFLVVGRHLKQAAARRLPPQFDSLVRQSAASSGRDMVSGPNLDVHVVVRALADKGERSSFHPSFPPPVVFPFRAREGRRRKEERERLGKRKTHFPPPLPLSLSKSKF